MPLYICYCPDTPGSTAKRTAHIEEHKKLSMESRAKGTTILGRALMSPKYTNTAASPAAVADTSDGSVHPGFVGSVMFYRFDNIDEAWARLKRDPFWINGIWDHDRSTVTELDPSPVDAEVAFK